MWSTYLLALTAAAVCGTISARASSNPLDSPRNATPLAIVSLCATIALFVLLVWGFFIFRWYVTLLTVPVAMVLGIMIATSIQFAPYAPLVGLGSGVLAVVLAVALIVAA